MKILEVNEIGPFDGVRVIKCQRFSDERGYFTEPYRKSDFEKVKGMGGINFVQSNESFSHAGVLRGLHFQWNPYMGKLVRVVEGDMIDLFLDIRIGSPTYGMMGDYRIESHRGSSTFEWIWVPPGFAHGNYFHEDTIIEYMCSGEYAGNKNEIAIWPMSRDINREHLSGVMKERLDDLNGVIISAKDKDGRTLTGWSMSEEAKLFQYNGG